MGRCDDLPPVDCHVHMRGDMVSVENLHGLMEACGYDGMSLMCIALRDDRGLKTGLLGLLFKALYPGKVYAFGGLRHPESGTVPDARPYAEQARHLLELGCDGIKMIEGKPTTRKMLGRPLDTPEYDGLYSYLEEESVPVLFHVADPETFWDPELAPPTAHERGWFYGDGTFTGKEELYAEAEGVLAKHPDLRVVFAHFYFLSADLDRLERFLADHPNVGVDITPGSEMYANFSAQTDRAREFFCDHADRIFFGTDIMGGWEPDPDLAQRETARVAGMRRFLETDDEFEWWGLDLHGIALPREALAAIYADNFRRWAGEKPRTVPISNVLSECERLENLTREAGLSGIADDLVQIWERFEETAR